MDWGASCRRLLYWILLAMVLLVPGLITRTALDKCVTIKDLCLVYWAAYAAVVVTFWAAIEFVSKAVVGVVRDSEALHHNTIYFVVQLYRQWGSLLWSVCLLVGWTSYLQPNIKSEDPSKLIQRLLGCYVAFRVGWLVRAWVVLSIAHKYMWQPYMERVQLNIFNQYVLLILTDHALGYKRNNKDQMFAEQFGESSTKKVWENTSMYAVSRAINFIPRHKLRHALVDSPAAASAHSHPHHHRHTSDGANAEANMERNANSTTSATASGDSFGSTLTLTGAKLRAAAFNFRMQMQANNLNPKRTKTTINTKKEARVLGNLLFTALVRGPSPTGHPEMRKSVAGHWGHDSPDANRSYTPERRRQEVTFDLLEFAGRGASKSPTKKVEADKLTLIKLRPVMSYKLAVKAFKIWSREDGETVTREEFVQVVEQIYRNRKSLALTLKDYERILQKLSQVIGGLLLFFLIFPCMAIFGQNLLTGGISLASFMVFFSFWLAPMAQSLVDSVVFIFVTRAYDVGDRVMITDELNTLEQLIVFKINLLSTVFKRGDETFLIFPHKTLSTKTIRNLRRSGQQYHLIWLYVSLRTPVAKLEALRKMVEDSVKTNLKTSLLYPKVDLSFSEIVDTTRLKFNLCVQQKCSFQDAGLRFRNYHALIKSVRDACEELDLTYALPEQPVLVKTKLP